MWGKDGKGISDIMDRAEKYLLILKSLFPDNEDLRNKIDAMVQLKRPEVLLNHEQKVYFEEFAEEWYERGWIIWNRKKSIEDVEEE